ncbi:MAG TPA: hypothetical protein VFU37_19470, partial [Pyrinomonadaceae bacterium]|nr:hypothetical protein [Pyrinomonadaceae bacterium]
TRKLRVRLSDHALANVLSGSTAMRYDKPVFSGTRVAFIWWLASNFANSPAQVTNEETNLPWSRDSEARVEEPVTSVATFITYSRILSRMRPNTRKLVTRSWWKRNSQGIACAFQSSIMGRIFRITIRRKDQSMKRLLIVDDEPNVRLNYRITLEVEGYNVVETGTALDALQKTQDSTV